MTSVIIKRAIFAVENFKIIQKDDIMMNIDESLISRSIRPSKSWNIRGETSELKSINMTESISFISWISSTGWNFNHIRNKSINSLSFVDFVTDLSSLWIQDYWKEGEGLYFWLIIHQFISLEMLKRFLAKHLFG